MEKATLKKIILEQQARIPGIKVRERDYVIEANANYIFTGQRRAGKTYFLYGIIQQMLSEGHVMEEIIYINFEDERLLELTLADLDAVLVSYKELFTHQPILFFDEIQNIRGWQKFARRMADSDFRIFITGSNSEMLSGEMATTLGGRFFIQEMDTLSFSEFLRFNDCVLTSNYEHSEERFEVFRLFEQYFIGGGFPELLKFTDKKDYLNTLFQKVFLGDIIARNQIRNTFALQLLVKKLAESTMDEVAYTRVRNIISSTGIKVGTSTVIEYVKYLQDAFLISNLSNYASKITERESKRKYYFRDNGLLALFLIEPESFLLENLVYNALRRKYKDKLFYIRNDYEVDFYIPGEKLIQVSYQLNNDVTRKRELNALAKAAQSYEVSDLLLITYQQEEQLYMADKEIQILPAWKWILRL
jgi:uncharacterized protein